MVCFVFFRSPYSALHTLTHWGKHADHAWCDPNWIRTQKNFPKTRPSCPMHSPLSKDPAPARRSQGSVPPPNPAAPPGLVVIQISSPCTFPGFLSQRVQPELLVTAASHNQLFILLSLLALREKKEKKKKKKGSKRQGRGKPGSLFCAGYRD